VRVDHCVAAVRTVDVPVLVFLRIGCNHVTDVGGVVNFVRLALKVIMPSVGDFVDVILLYHAFLNSFNSGFDSLTYKYPFTDNYHSISHRKTIN